MFSWDRLRKAHDVSARQQRSRLFAQQPQRCTEPRSVPSTLRRSDVRYLESKPQNSGRCSWPWPPFRGSGLPSPLPEATTDETSLIKGKRFAKFQLLAGLKGWHLYGCNSAAAGAAGAFCAYAATHISQVLDIIAAGRRVCPGYQMRNSGHRTQLTSGAVHTPPREVQPSGLRLPAAPQRAELVRPRFPQARRAAGAPTSETRTQQGALPMVREIPC